MITINKILYIAGFLLLYSLDQVSKLAVVRHLQLHEIKVIIPGFFNIFYIHNPGAAFGILQNQPELFRMVFFITLTILMCIFIVYMSIKEKEYAIRKYCYMAILAGACGNLTDRIRLGHVIDFLDVYYKSYHWYTFNIADSYITISVVILIWDALNELKRA